MKKDSDYKKFVFPLPVEVTNHNIEEIESLFSKFKKDELFIEIKNKEIIFFIRLMNIGDLEHLLEDIKEKEMVVYEIVNEIKKKIASIGSYGIKDGKRLFVGYNDERKVQNRKEKEKRRRRHFYTNNNNFLEKNNSLPNEYLNKIICGDSEQILKKLPENCIDIVFTSPPYNFGLGYDDQRDDANWEIYFENLFKIFDEAIRILKFGGRFIINIQPLFSDYIPSHHIVSNYLMNKKLIWKSEILWEKNNYNCKYTSWGSYKSPSSPYLKYTWEFLEVFTKGTLKKSGLKERIDITADEFKEWVIAKWSIAPERNMKKYNHPAMFPEELVRRGLKLFSYQNDVVLDPFNGVGTTTLVAKKTGRKYIGIDISEEYCETAKKRLAEILL